MSEPTYRIRLVIDTANEGISPLGYSYTYRVLYDFAPGRDEVIQAADDILKTLDDRARFDELRQSDY